MTELSAVKILSEKIKEFSGLDNFSHATDCVSERWKSLCGVCCILNSTMLCWNRTASSTISFNLCFDSVSFFTLKRSISSKCRRKSVQSASRKKHGPMKIDRQQFCVPNSANWMKDWWNKKTMNPPPENLLYGVLKMLMNCSRSSSIVTRLGHSLDKMQIVPLLNVNVSAPKVVQIRCDSN